MSELQIVESALRRSRNLFFSMGIFLILLGALIAAACFLDGSLPTGSRWGGGAFGAVVSILGLFLGRKGFGLLDIPGSPLMHALREQPERIVWYFVQVINTQVQGAQVATRKTVYVCLVDGSRHLLSVPAKDLEATLSLLARTAPHAQAGHSQEIEKLFKQNPKLLVRSN